MVGESGGGWRSWGGVAVAQQKEPRNLEKPFAWKEKRRGGETCTLLF